MSELSIAFSPGSMEKLKRSADKRSKLLNEDVRKTLVKTSVQVIKALRASARVSPEKRKVEKVRPDIGAIQHSVRLQYKIKQWYQAHGTPARRRPNSHPAGYIPFKDRHAATFAAIKSRKPGERKELPIFKATDLKEAKLSPLRNIEKPGLARDSFRWMLGKLGNGESAPNKEKPGITSVTKSEKSDQSGTKLSVSLTNRLRYILSALSGGRRDVATALERARSLLVYDTKRALKARHT